VKGIHLLAFRVLNRFRCSPGNLQNHMKSCCRQLWKDLEKKKADSKFKPADQKLTQSWANAQSKAQQKTWSAQEQETAKRALALLSACGEMPFSLGEKRWFQLYARILSRGQHVPPVHTTVTTHISKIDALDIQPAIKEELKQVSVCVVESQSDY